MGCESAGVPVATEDIGLSPEIKPGSVVRP